MSGATIPGTASSGADLADLFATAAPRNIAAGGGRTIRVLGNRVTYKAVAGQTGGAYSLFELVVDPGAGVPPHHGRYEDEAFWILEGRFSLWLGNETLYLGPGGYAFAPRGTVHAFTNVGDMPGRLLMLVIPGGLHERYLDELGGVRGVPQAPASPAEMERVGMIAAKSSTGSRSCRWKGGEPDGINESLAPRDKARR